MMFQELWEIFWFRLFAVCGVPLILLFSGLYLYSFFFGSQKIKRLFSNLPFSNISDCQAGIVLKIKGDLCFTDDINKTPFSNRSCSLFELTFEEEYTPHSQRDNLFAKNSWREITSRKKESDFLLFNGSDYALVKTEAIISLLDRELMLEKVSGSSFLEGREVSLKKLMRELGISPSEYVHYDAGIRIYEAILEKGESVSVCGKGKWIKTIDIPNLNDINTHLPDEIFVFQGNKKSPLYITDNKDIIGV